MPAGEAVADRGPGLRNVLWVLTGLALATALLRIYVRLRNRLFGWDDIFMVITMVRGENSQSNLDAGADASNCRVASSPGQPSSPPIRSTAVPNTSRMYDCAVKRILSMSNS